MREMRKYTVAQAGCGARGKAHLDGFLANSDRFEIVGVCDLDEPKMREAALERGLGVPQFTDAEAMLAATRPDVFCFVTLPGVRLPLVELAVKYGVRGLALEKPMATTLREAAAMARLCREAGIKAVVCHQHKYLESLRQVKALVDAGEIGEMTQIQATCQAFLAQLGTHYVDYVLWANGGRRAKWIVGHIHGREMLADSHPSPDYSLGHVEMENGVRAFFSFGKESPQYYPEDWFWLDDRLTVFGTQGYAWGDATDRWGALTKSSGGKVIEGEGPGWGPEVPLMQAAYTRDLADWLDDDAKLHPCNLEIAYHGFEIMEGLCLSALDNARVDFPLDPEAEEPALERMRRELR